ncbi:MAG: hypothetical protein JWO30_2869 [Fibrobacteres bacterium]|nr:hypothetical protein [Fibrobacterota bacterium]
MGDMTVLDSPKGRLFDRARRNSAMSVFSPTFEFSRCLGVAFRSVA